MDTTLDAAKAGLATLTDRQLVAAVTKLREARGLTGYGSDHARRTKAQKLSDAEDAAFELFKQNGGDTTATGALVQGIIDGTKASVSKLDLSTDAPSGKRFELGKKHGHDTFRYREALKGLGFLWDPKSDVWHTSNAEAYENGLYVVTGKRPGGATGTGGGQGAVAPDKAEQGEQSEAGDAAQASASSNGDLLDALQKSVQAAMQAQGKAQDGDGKGDEGGDQSEAQAQADAQAQDVFGPRGVSAIKSLIDTNLDESKVAEIAAQVAGELDAEQGKLMVQGLQALDNAIQALQKQQADAPAQAAPVDVKVTFNNAPPVDANGMHDLATKVAALVGAGVNVGLVGMPGAGKTHLLHDVAKLLAWQKTGAISLSAGVTEAPLTGRVLPIGDGRYLPTPFITIYEDADKTGGVFLFDELDAADPNVLLVVNAALANSGFYVEARSVSGLDPFIKRGERVGMLAGLNTAGTGGDSRFTGRQALDAATIDRWYRIRFPYDDGIIANLFGAKSKHAANPWRPCDLPFDAREKQAWHDWYHVVRGKLDAQKSPMLWTPRIGQKISAARSVGCTPKEIVSDLFAFAKPAELEMLGDLAHGPAGYC